MRMASSGSGIIRKGKRFQGIVFGTGFCAEHEFGSKVINELLGLEKPGRSLEDRTIATADNVQLSSIEYRGKEFLILTASKRKYEGLCSDLKYAPSSLLGEGWLEKPSEVKIAWDGDEGFQCVFHPNNSKEAEKLFKELQNNNVAFMMSMRLRKAGLEIDTELSGPALVIINKMGEKVTRNLQAEVQAV